MKNMSKNSRKKLINICKSIITIFQKIIPTKKEKKTSKMKKK